MTTMTMTLIEVRRMLARRGLDTAADFATLYRLVVPRSFHRAALSPDAIDHLIELGFTTASDIATVCDKPVDEYAALGVTTVEEIAFASNHGLTPPVITTYRKHDVVDLPAMAKLKRAGVGATTVAAYTRIPGFTMDDAVRLKEAEVSAKAARDLVKMGADSVDAVIAMSHFTSDQVELMSRFGFTADQVKAIGVARPLPPARVAELVAADPTITPDEIIASGRRVGWVELIEATPQWRDWREPGHQHAGATVALIQAGATVAQAVKLLIEPTQKGRTGAFPLGGEITRRALGAGFTPTELVDLVDRHTNLTTVWHLGSRATAPTAPTRTDHEAALRVGVSLSDLADWKVIPTPMTPEQVAGLVDGGWRPSFAKETLQAGFTLDDLIASPFKPKVEAVVEEPEVDDESPRGPDDWDW